MAVALIRALLSEQLRSAEVLGRGAGKDKLESDLTARLGVDVRVDDAPDLRHLRRVDDSCASVE
eukprot:1156213-Pyramimonas_sp.AAC.1